jgi:hypothetical protein
MATLIAGLLAMQRGGRFRERRKEREDGAAVGVLASFLAKTTRADNKVIGLLSS